MKTVLITGGVRGIGKSIALAFLKKGYRVCAAYSKDEEGAAAVRALGIETYLADVSNEAAVQALFEKIGKVDVLINNAGVALVKQIQDVTMEEFNRVMSINVGGAFLCAREAAKGMISRQSGLIVNISSVWGEVGGSCESVYSASKAALLGFTKALAKELGWSKIRVNSVSPGVIDTPMNARFSEEEMQALKEEIPVGRIGTGEDVAAAVLFLEENEYVTGVDIPVNGGFSIV
ncbi:MAG: SDR family oxidoreductase [Clostridiales bacterium]|nr:SDR family oxidoreductase [Clostridiales bacterium]MBQ2769076.1 SDR family oxidoreductase [Clostridia bacterium]